MIVFRRVTNLVFPELLDFTDQMERISPCKLICCIMLPLHSVAWHIASSLTPLGPSQKKVDTCRLIFLLCRSTTYLLHLVTLHLLLVVCSTQLASATPLLAAGNNPFLEVLLDNKRLTQKLTSVLLRHYSDFRPLPPKAPLYQPDQDEPAGVFRLVRSAAGTPSPASCLPFLQNTTLDPNRLDSYLLWDESLVFLSGRHYRILMEVCNRARVCLDPHWGELSRPFLVNLPKDRQLQS